MTGQRVAAARSHAAPDAAPKPVLVVKFAEDPAEMDDVFRLRHRLFVVGAGLAPPGSDGRERDAYDAACDHLIVKDVATGVVAGCYRMLPGWRRGARGFYTESEFDLEGFVPLAPETLELGRSCIHPDYRRGPAMGLLWNGMLAHFLGGFRYLIGCVSVKVSSVGELNEIFTMFHAEGAVTDRYGIRPLPSHRIEGVRVLPGVDTVAVRRRLPTLVKGYLRIGGEVGVRKPRCTKPAQCATLRPLLHWFFDKGA